jgi:uncharacterized membrane protein
MVNFARDRGDGIDRETARLEAFSDGVIAIAITLLVLDVHVPQLQGADRAHLWSALVDLWPSYVGYLLSFTVIGIIWANHHDIFRHIGRVDRTLVLINLLFLLTVSFFPFPTALLAEYLGHEGEKTATIVYTGWAVFMALTYNLLWRYPVRHGLLAPDADPAVIAAISKRFDLGPPSYLLAFAVSFVAPLIAIAISGILALIYVFPLAFRRTKDEGRRTED